MPDNFANHRDEPWALKDQTGSHKMVITCLRQMIHVGRKKRSRCSDSHIANRTIIGKQMA